MSETKSPHTRLTRRSFLKTTGAVAGAAALGSVATPGLQALAEGDTSRRGEERVFSGSCRGNCFGGCMMNLTVRDDKLVRVDPAPLSDSRFQRICQRGRSSVQTVYNDHRVLYPMRRVDGTERGAGEWERVSWDEALDEICSKWKAAQENYGESALAFHTSSGNYGAAFGYISWQVRLLNVLNATNVQMVYDSANNNSKQRCGLTTGLTPASLLESGCIVLWGNNVSESQVQTWHFINEAMEKGAKLIVIDPNYTTCAAKADLWLPLRPGTDGVFALAACNEVVKRGLVDWDDVKIHSTLPFLVKDDGTGYLKVSDIRPLAEGEKDAEVMVASDGTVDAAANIPNPLVTGVTEVQGIPVRNVYDLVMERISEWTKERCLEICDITDEQFENFLTMYIENAPVAVNMGLALDHYCNGSISIVDTILLSVLTGNVAKRGGGFDSYSAAAMTPFLCDLSYSVPTGPSTGPAVVFQLLPEIMETKKFGKQDVDIHCLYIWSSNPLSNMPERLALIEAMNKIEFVVVADYCMTDTCKYADIVLPAAHYYEQFDVGNGFSQFMCVQEPAINPPCDAKTDYEIIKLIAEGMGVGDLFDFTEEEYLRAIMDSPALRAYGITYDRLMEEKFIELKDYYGKCMTAKDKRVNMYFGRVGGRYNPKPAYGGWYDYGQEYDADFDLLPGWEPPYEAWPDDVAEFKKSAQAEKYSLVYTTYRNKFRCHSQFGYNEWLLEIFPEPYLMMNPKDMEVRGVEDRQYVRVFNDRGEMVVRAVKNNGIREGMVVIPKGWHGDQFKKGHYSDLTSRYMNPAVPNGYFFDALCEVEPYDGGDI